MNIKQFFERLDIPDFIKFINYKAYQEMDKVDDPEKYQHQPLKDRIQTINEENKVALREFTKVMVEIRLDPEFWSDIVKYSEKTE